MIDLRFLLKSKFFFLFLIFSSVYLYRVNQFVDNQIHSATYWWFYNYSQGFTKRGLIGEILLILNKILDINIFLLIKIFHFSSFIIFLLFFFRFIKKFQDKNIFYLLLVFSPIGLMVYVYDPFFIARPEIFIFLSMIFYLSILSQKFNFYKFFLVSFFLSLTILVHEITIFFLSYFFLFFFLKKTEIKSKHFYPFFILPLLTSLAIIFFSKKINIDLMCGEIFLMSTFLNDCKSSMAAGSQVMGFKAAWQDTQSYIHSDFFLKIYSFGFVLSLAGFFLYFYFSKIKLKFFFNFLLFFLINLIYSIPIFFLSYDWGRWLFVHFMLNIIILGFIYRYSDIKVLKNKYQIFFLFLYVIYTFAWNMPACCVPENKSLGSGFLGILNKIFASLI